MNIGIRALVVSLLLSAVAISTGCSYAGVAAVDADTVVIAKNNAFLFGILNEVYVCQVSDSGLTACATGQSP